MILQRVVGQWFIHDTPKNPFERSAWCSWFLQNSRWQSESCATELWCSQVPSFECIQEACGVPKARVPFFFLFQTNFKEKRAPPFQSPFQNMTSSGASGFDMTPLLHETSLKFIHVSCTRLLSHSCRLMHP